MNFLAKPNNDLIENSSYKNGKLYNNKTQFLSALSRYRKVCHSIFVIFYGLDKSELFSICLQDFLEINSFTIINTFLTRA